MQTSVTTTSDTGQTIEGSRSEIMMPTQGVGLTSDTIACNTANSKAIGCVCIVQFEKDEHRQYTCGGCSHKFVTVCLLHEHLKLHGSGGSYHFDHVSNTAIPKYDTFCSFTQTDANFYDERADAPLASLSDEEASYHGCSDYEATDEAGAKDQDVNSSYTDKDSDLFTNLMKSKNVDEHAKIKTVNKKSSLIAKVVLIDIKDSIKDTYKKGLSSDTKVTGHITKVKNLASKTPMALRSGRHSYPKQNKRLIKKLQEPEKRKATDKDPDYEIDNDVMLDSANVTRPTMALRKKKQTSTQQTNGVRWKKQGKKKPAKKPIDLDYEMGDNDTDINDVDNIKQEIKDIAAVDVVNNSPRATGTNVEFKEPQKIEPFGNQPDKQHTKSNDQNNKVHNETLEEDIAMDNKDTAKQMNKKGKVSKTKIKKLVTCEICNKTLQKKALRKHMFHCHTNKPIIVKQNPPWVCEICNKTLHNKYGLKLHLLYHAAKKAKIEDQNLLQTCEICNKVMTKKKLKKHMKRHVLNNEFVICDKCGQSISRSKMAFHQISHLDVKPFQCSLCSAQFCTKTPYDRHMSRHQGHRSFVCNVCDERFYTIHTLHAHQQCVHMGMKTFKCEHCEKMFFKKYTLERHQVVHFEPALECKFCGWKTRHKMALLRHERTHTGIKKYQCHLCDHGFIQNTPYYTHLIKRHGMEHATVKKMLKKLLEANKFAGIKPGGTIMLPRVDDYGDNEPTNPHDSSANSNISVACKVDLQMQAEGTIVSGSIGGNTEPIAPSSVPVM